jgi:crossover junction endodeoxyribonuclease RusA
MVITFPWPPKELSPNARVHWAEKAKAAKKYKSDCLWICREAKVQPEIDDDEFHLIVEFRPPSKRRADIDNMLSSIKQALDAVSEATGIDDSKFALHLKRVSPVKNGAVVISI